MNGHAHSLRHWLYPRHAWFACAAVCLLLLGTTGCGKPYLNREIRKLDAPAPADRLIVHNQFGDITIEGDASAKDVRATVTLTGRGATQAYADEAIGEITVAMTETDDRPGVLVASAEHPNATHVKDYEVEWKLIAPPSLPVEVRSDFGDVTVRHFERGAQITTDFGDVSATAAGPLMLQTDFGDMHVLVQEGALGSVRVSTDFGDVRLRLPCNRKGRLAAETDFGSLNVDVRNILVRVTHENDGRLEVLLEDDSQPAIDVSTDFGDVMIDCYPSQSEATDDTSDEQTAAAKPTAPR